MSNMIYQALIKIARDRKGQDMLEYALLASTFAVVCGAIFPPTVAPSISSIFSKVVSSFNAAP